ncbi:hypothetical protein UFOVP32_41 [uncultured Caudovirales phage]|uniref:Uncharacterized protein n=1 Tax=uncultured Caudovirales phage TaxID=2100421 RepID=A0A6J5KP71_9CAUD|nr:hypothetical protein UFOVP32_41 [uncultured Caudovirales phage]CAB4123651.1 hypothetical protein UFOVP50_35 [uncultured Caudovirales phage]
MIDINKKYRTRDGREVRIYATDGGPNKMSVHGAINYGENWQSCSWHSLGVYYADSESEKDLIEVRPRHKRTVWMNIYGPESFTSHISREHAEDEQDVNRIACIKVELDFEEGEGL